MTLLRDGRNHEEVGFPLLIKIGFIEAHMIINQEKHAMVLKSCVVEKWASNHKSREELFEFQTVIFQSNYFKSN